MELELYDDCDGGVFGVLETARGVLLGVIDLGALFGGVTGIDCAVVAVGSEGGKNISLAEMAGGLEGGVDKVSAGATTRRLGIAAGIAAPPETTAGTATVLT